MGVDLEPFVGTVVFIQTATPIYMLYRQNNVLTPVRMRDPQDVPVNPHDPAEPLKMPPIPLKVDYVQGKLQKRAGENGDYYVMYQNPSNPREHIEIALNLDVIVSCATLGKIEIMSSDEMPKVPPEPTAA